MARLTRLALALLLWIGVALPAQAAVTVTFWSHEFGNSFPHAFLTLRGVPDAGGVPVDRSYGFTAKTVSPALLFGSVPGVVESTPVGYMNGSDAQFSVVLTDAQYDQLLQLFAAWDQKTGDGHYNLNNRNCVHFVREAARIAGLMTVDFPQLMKKPRSYLLAVADANAGHLTRVTMHGKEYLASLPPMSTAPVAAGLAPSAIAQTAAAAIPPVAATTPAPSLHVLPPNAPVPAPIY